MALTAAEVVLLIKAKDEASATLNHVEKQAGGLSGVLKTAAGTALGFVGAMGGIAAVKGVFSSVIGGAIESQKVMSQTEAVIKSTGGAAGLTAKEVADLAGEFQKITPFEDEAIQSAENMLLTFTSIGKDVFPAATKTVLNMSTALGQDLKSSSIQLGKALNDPIQGVTALRRVGVQFTDAQQEMIAGLVESGDLLGAQTLILKELEIEFGGSAEAAGKTFGGQLAILKNRLGDVAEGIGLKLLPLLLKASAFMINNVIPVVEKFADGLGTLVNYFRIVFTEGDTLNDFLADLPGPLQDVTKAVGEVALFIKEQAVPALIDLGGILAKIAEDYIKKQVLPALSTLKQGWDDLRPVLATVAGFLNDNVVPILAKVGQFLLDHKPILIALAAAILLLVAPWLAVIAAIVLVLAKWDEIKAMFTTTIPNAIDSVITKIKELPIIGEIFQAAFNAALLVVKMMFGFIKIEVEMAINIVRDVIKIVTALIRGDWNETWKGIKQLVIDIWDGIKGIVNLQIKAIKGLLKIEIDLIVGILGDAWDLVKDKVESIWKDIKDFITGAAQTIKTWFTSNWPEIATIISGPFAPLVLLATDAFGVRSALEGAMTAVKNWVSDRINDIVGFFAALPGRALGAMGNVANALVGAGGTLIEGLGAGAYNATIGVLFPFFRGIPGAILTALGDLSGILWDAGWNLIKGFVDGMLSVPIPNPLDLIPDLTPGFNVPGIPGLQRGGFVPARPGGTIARLAESGEGEWVVPESRMRGGGMGFGLLTVKLYINAIDGPSVERIAPRILEAIERVQRRRY